MLILFVIEIILIVVEGTKNELVHGCDIYHTFHIVGESAVLKSPNYPSNYLDNVDCRYTLDSPVGTRMSINCSEFNVESSAGNCVYDVFFMSPNGDSTFEDQEYFCGQGGWSRTSKSNRLALGFHSDESNPSNGHGLSPYRFQCIVSVIQQSNNNPLTCNCGTTPNISNNMKIRIVGGTDASVGEFPWRVTLYSVKLGVFCGGTIISTNYILTAAHCTAGVEPGDMIYVNAGDFDLSSSTDSPSQLVSVDYAIQNNRYNEGNQDSDISLLRLRNPLKFNNYIGAICLPWKYQNMDFTGKIVTASGWGTEYFGGGISSTLKKVDLPILEREPCAELYSGSSVTVTNNMICTYFNGKDTCQGDSGGSIDYKESPSGRWYAIGVTSHGVSCGQSNQPGVYTRIGNFLHWIQSNAATETFCKV